MKANSHFVWTSCAMCGLVSLFSLAASRPALHSKTPPAERVRIIAPVADGVLRCRPTFIACGVCFGAAKPIDGLRLEYRVKGESAWKSTTEFPYFAETKDYRGSILDLQEDTTYEVRVAGQTTTFRTWASKIPVAKTVTIDPRTATFPIRISEKGSPAGWIRYVVAGGAPLVNGTTRPTIALDGAEYVVVDGITFKGGAGRHAITIEKTRGVRVVNCQFSHWGRASKPRYDALGRPFEAGAPEGQIVRNANNGFSYKGKGGVNFDGAIDIGRGAQETVVERCWFHDCTIHANSWYYSHPAGGEGIMLSKPDHSTVIRWCDFTGSDLHRWNDAVESAGNFAEDGGFNRDADFYGNFIIFANDDCIELDGGQQNVRCYDNRFESALCGVSIQGCMASPVYVKRNVFFGMCDEFGSAGQTIKTGGGAHGEEAYAYISRNLFWGPGSGISMMELLRARLENNIFCDWQQIGSLEQSPHSASTGDRFGVELEEAKLPVSRPVRPLGFTLDRSRFSGIKVAKGVVSPATLTVTARSTAQTDTAFSIALNDDTPWLKVSPARGVIPAGKELALTVSFDTAKMDDRRNYRGAFLVRTPEGLSRPVSVYVETDFVPPARPEKPGDTVVYGPAKKDGGEIALSADDKEDHAYEFVVPKDGRYHFMAHARITDRAKVRFTAWLDDEEPKAVDQLRLLPYSVWVPVAPGNGFGNTLRFWDFKAGERHVLHIRGIQARKNVKVLIDSLVMTDNPGSFEPR